MTAFPKISIVTVNFNQAKYLEDAIKSVVSQNYPNLEYIVMDGGSTDESVEIIKKYQDQIDYWVSEPDEGQYHAIQKGFNLATGEIMSWLNSDDMFQPYSLFGVASIFNQFEDVNWITGIAREYTESGNIVNRIMPNWSRWSKYRYLTYDFQFIQQESTFWKRELWEKAGGSLDLEYALAGDMELWARFFRHEKLYTTTIGIGGFRYRSDDQKSVINREEYLKESRHIIERERKRYNIWFRACLYLLKPYSLLSAPFFFHNIPVLKMFYRVGMGIPHMINYNPKTHLLEFSDGLTKYPPIVVANRILSRRGIKKIKSQ